MQATIHRQVRVLRENLYASRDQQGLPMARDRKAQSHCPAGKTKTRLSHIQHPELFFHSRSIVPQSLQRVTHGKVAES